MYLTIKQQLKHLTKEEYLTLKDLTQTAKNLYNVALYNIRQQFFQHGNYLNYYKNYRLCKDNENYNEAKILQTSFQWCVEIAQQFLPLLKNIKQQYESANT